MRARVMLARMLADGTGVAADPAEAIRLLEAAAGNGDRDAQGLLAVTLARGEGVPPDPGAAYVWAAVAAMRGHGAAAGLFAGLERSLSGPEKSAALRRLVARRDVPAAPATMALARAAALAAQAPGETPAGPDPLRSLREAAEAGDREAQYRLAERLADVAAESGRAEALRWAIAADLAGHPLAKARRDAICAGLPGSAIVAAVRAATVPDPKRRGQA